MLADASISRADISKATPPPPRPGGHRAHARRPAAALRGWQAEAAATGARPPAAGGRCQEGGSAHGRHRGEEGLTPRRGGSARGRRRGEEGSLPRRGGPASREGSLHRGGPLRRGWRCASGMGGRTTSARPSSLAARDGAACVSRRSGAARRVGEEGRVGDGCGEERRRGGRARRGRTTRFGGKRLSALEGDGVYTEPPPFVTVHVSNRDKRPFSLGSCYDPRLKAPLLSQLEIRTVTKGAFRAGCPRGEFSPFCHGWCYNP
jgi:hypothetical protein